MRIQREDVLSLIIFFTIIAVFFFRFFWPEPQVLVTPDFGRSDAWHFSLATKFILSQSLKSGTLPLWNWLIGSGFPVFAEGQVGTLFIPNLLLYRFADPITAYNLSILFALVAFGSGMYVWLRLLRLPWYPSLFVAVTISFSGIMMTQPQHIALLGGVSLTTWVMVLTHRLARRPSVPRAVVLAFILAQQMLAGFPQATFVTLLFAVPYFIYLVHRTQTSRTAYTLIFLAVILAFGLSSIQVIPSWEFLRLSTQPSGFSPDTASFYSFPLVHLVTFLQPFALGNPKFGTYPDFQTFGGSMFWENNGFIGVLPIFLILLIPWLKRFGTKNDRQILTYLLFTLIASFLLMLGSHSPVYLVYSIWPFNLFRVPSRFIWIFVLSLAAISGYALSWIWRLSHNRPVVRLLIIAASVVSTVQLLGTWWSYNLIQPKGEWLTPPAIVSKLRSKYRIFTVADKQLHNKTFLTSGWEDPAPYVFLRNTLAANSNVYWGIPQHSVYAGRLLLRPTIIDGALESNLMLDDDTATVSAFGQKLLDLLSIDRLVSAVPIDGETVKLQDELTDDDQTIRIYRNETAVPRAYLATDIAIATTAEEALRKLQGDAFIPGRSVLLEETKDEPNADARGEVTVADISPTQVQVTVRELSSQAYLVLTDTYYPGWTATIDGRPTTVVPANVRQRAVFVPPGSHVIEFFYQPASFRKGRAITIGAIILSTILVAAPRFAYSARTRKKASLRARSRQRNRGR